MDFSLAPNMAKVLFRSPVFQGDSKPEYRCKKSDNHKERESRK